MIIVQSCFLDLGPLRYKVSRKGTRATNSPLFDIVTSAYIFQTPGPMCVIDFCAVTVDPGLLSVVFPRCHLDVDTPTGRLYSEALV